MVTYVDVCMCTPSPHMCTCGWVIACTCTMHVRRHAATANVGFTRRLPILGAKSMSLFVSCRYMSCCQFHTYFVHKGMKGSQKCSQHEPSVVVNVTISGIHCTSIFVLGVHARQRFQDWDVCTNLHLLM